jgi:hypothetical protein
VAAIFQDSVPFGSSRRLKSNLSIELTREGRALRAKAETASSKFVAACELGQAEGGDLRDKLALLTKTLRNAG